MQDRYAGDLGDFGTFGLLRALCRPGEGCEERFLRLGVVWYLVPDEGHNADGKHIGFLEPTDRNLKRFSDCDAALYRALASIVDNHARQVASIRDGRILPVDTIFYEEALTFAGMSKMGPTARQRRLDHRDAWVRGAWEKVAPCDLVFVDPDNGLETGVQRHHKRGPKYAFFDELQCYLQRGQSLVVYQHVDHTCRVDEQVRRRLSQLDERFRPNAGLFALRYRRGTARAFLVVPHESHAGVLYRRAEALCQDRNPWAQHFELIR
jgi:hypothetical protein